MKVGGNSGGVNNGQSGDGFLGRGSEPPANQLGDRGSAVSSPSWVLGGAQADHSFSYILSALDGFPCYVVE